MMFFLQNRMSGRGISMDMDIDGDGLTGHLFSESFKMMLSKIS